MSNINLTIKTESVPLIIDTLAHRASVALVNSEYLEHEIAGIEAKNKKLADSMDTLLADNTAMNNEIAELRKERADSVLHAGNLSKEISNLNAMLSQAEDELADAKSIVKELYGYALIIEQRIDDSVPELNVSSIRKICDVEDLMQECADMMDGESAEEN